MSQSILQEWFPSTNTPFISNAPMFGTANAKLASAVSKASGFGFIGGGFDFSDSSTQIPALDGDLKSARKLLGHEADPMAVLPIGIGFITFHSSVSNFLNTVGPVVLKHRVAAVWLFAPATSLPGVHGDIVTGLKKLGAEWKLRVFIQVGTVEAAREVARQGADVIVAQGIDAGGHQWARGAGIVSLVPEIRDMLQTEFPKNSIAVVAAGGISDGRATAAALALGADGVTMGTRFIVAEESPTSDEIKQTILDTVDGAASTVKDTIHDDIQGTGFWPSLYDGRAVIGKSYEDHLAGVPLDKLTAQYRAAAEAKDNSMKIVWAGSGIGLVREKLPAGEIVKQVQNEARSIIRGISGNFSA